VIIMIKNDILKLKWNPIVLFGFFLLIITLSGIVHYIGMTMITLSCGVLIMVMDNQEKIVREWYVWEEKRSKG